MFHKPLFFGFLVKRYMKQNDSNSFDFYGNERKKDLKNFLSSLRLKIRNLDLLNIALAHKSFINEKQIKEDNNEKLEFLGDSVLGLIITEYLYTNFPESTEGDLARIKSFVVSEKTLTKLARKIGLDRFILMGKGEELSGGRRKKAILADTFEAFLGCYYLDSNYQKVACFVIDLFKDEIDLVFDDRHEKDYKTLLQEYVQKKYKHCPEYKMKGNTGPEHNKTFFVEVFVKGKIAGFGEGKSKKEAEQAAAKNAYRKINSTVVTTGSFSSTKKK